MGEGVLAFGENCTEICRAIRMYCQRLKCSPWTVLVIKVMEVFTGVTVTEQEASNQ